MSAQSCEAKLPTVGKGRVNVQVEDGSPPSKTNEETSEDPNDSEGSYRNTKGFESESSEGSINTRMDLARAKAERRLKLRIDCGESPKPKNRIVN